MRRSFLISFSLLVCFIAEAALTDGLVAYWPLEQTAGLRRDMEPNGVRQGLAPTGNISAVTGKIGNAAQLDISVVENLARVATNSAALHFGDVDYSLSGWVNLSSTNADQFIWSVWNSTGNQRAYGLQYLKSAGAVRWLVSGDGTGSFSQAQSTFFPTLDTPFHVTVWHDSGANQIGISINDGTAVTAAHSTGTFAASTAPFCFGNAAAVANALTFWVDELGVWDRVLSGAERTSLYNTGSGLQVLADGIIDYYVATTGANTDAGSLANPFQNISYAITQMAGGDITSLRGGTFTNDWNLDGLPSGTSSSMTTIKSYLSELPIIKPNTTASVNGFSTTSGSYLCFQGLEVDLTTTTSTGAGLRLENSDHSRITNCVIHHIATGHGILLTGTSDDAQVWNCTIHHAGWQFAGGTEDHGIYTHTLRNSIVGNHLYENQSHGLHASSGNTHDAVVAYNIAHNNGNTGLGIYSGTNAIFYNNICYSNGFAGFKIGFKAGYNQVANNTVWKNAVNYRVDSDLERDGLTFENNISADASEDGWRIGTTTNVVTVRYCLSVGSALNDFLDGSGVAVTNNNRFGPAFNAGFVNASATNLALLSTSSARNSGTPQTLFSTDFIGTSRPQEAVWDIGAYEFISPVIGTFNAATVNVGTIQLATP